MFPSNDDDVVTSPYNSLLAASKLVEYADCVLPIDNEALIRLVSKKDIEEQDKEKQKKEAYASMNTMIAHLLSNLTCSMRYPGSLNIDMNEITMNLVPYPRMHFLIASMAPLHAFIKQKSAIPRSLDQMFMDTLSRDNHLIDCNSQQHRYISLAYLIRGDLSFSDVSRNIEKISSKINLIDWNSEGFKYGICSVPSLGRVRRIHLTKNKSVLSLSNNTGFSEILSKMMDRFNKLYRKKVYVHHYTKYLDESIFPESLECLDSLNQEYFKLMDYSGQREIERFKPLF